MYDFQITWTPISNLNEGNNLKLFQPNMEIIGRKEFICKNFKFIKPYPALGCLFDNNNII